MMFLLIIRIQRTQDLLNTSQTLLPLDPWQRSRRQATKAALPRGLSRILTDLVQGHELHCTVITLSFLWHFFCCVFFEVLNGNVPLQEWLPQQHTTSKFRMVAICMSLANLSLTGHCVCAEKYPTSSLRSLSSCTPPSWREGEKREGGREKHNQSNTGGSDSVHY